MTETNNENLGSLEEFLLGNLNATGNADDGYERLQELLIKPEMIRIRDQVARLEKELPQILKVRARVVELEQEFPKLLGMQDRLSGLEQEIPEFLGMRDRLSGLEQEIPELLGMRDHVDRLEDKLAQLERQIDRSEELTKLMLPLISELLNRKFAEFKKEMLSEITPLIEKLAQEEKSLSIRVSGLPQTTQ
jgi:hypothetical protein